MELIGPCDFCVAGATGIIAKVGAMIGQGTNNEAEYNALISSLRHALRLGFFSASVVSDSLLVVNQMSGEWKVREAKLRRLHSEATALSRLFTSFKLRHAYREENAGADALSRVNHFEEPALPAHRTVVHGKFNPKLYDWQAAAIRVWWKRAHAGPGLLSRVFGVERQLVERIMSDQTYLDSTFDGFDEYMLFLLDRKAKDAVTAL